MTNHKTAAKSAAAEPMDVTPTRDPTPVTPTAPTWPPTCGTCKFYAPQGSLCRVDSPQLTAGSPSTIPINAGVVTFPPSVSYWPIVNKDVDWCGQYIAAG